MGTTCNILKGIEWATCPGARVEARRRARLEDERGCTEDAVVSARARAAPVGSHQSINVMAGHSRPSDGYGTSESDAVLRTAMGTSESDAVLQTAMRGHDGD
jgi:hypothetical protein